MNFYFFKLTTKLHALIADMFETIHAANGSGLTAPQIGINFQLVILGFGENQRYPDVPSVPETVPLKPALTSLASMLEEGWDGCLSVPGFRGVVPGYTHLH